MNNMNEKRLEGATWLPRSAKDGFKECRENFMLHVIKRHQGVVEEEYVKSDGTRCEECWNLAMRVMRSWRDEKKIEVVIGGLTWRLAVTACGMERSCTVPSDGNGGSGEPYYSWHVLETTEQLTSATRSVLHT